MLTYYDQKLLQSRTTNGGDWLHKYVHPPSAKGTSYNGYPDQSTNVCLHFENKLPLEITANLETGSPNSISALHLISPGLINQVYRANSITPGFVNQWSPQLINTDIKPLEIQNSFGMFRPAYMSKTINFDATGFNNTGMLTVAQFVPSVFNVDVATFLNMYVSDKYDENRLQAFIKASPKYTAGPSTK
jgi:hypothetical protein